MSRAPYQVLVFPYFIKDDGSIEYAIFKRQDTKYWQGIAGGGEAKETPLEAAYRESMEEAKITKGEYTPLISSAIIPVVNINGFIWGNNIFVIPEYSFGVKLLSKAIQISIEHLEFKWCSYEEAHKSLKWDSNTSALWELNYRLVNSVTNIQKNLDIIKQYKFDIF